MEGGRRSEKQEPVAAGSCGGEELAGESAGEVRKIQE